MGLPTKKQAGAPQVSRTVKFPPVLPVNSLKTVFDLATISFAFKRVFFGHAKLSLPRKAPQNTENTEESVY